MAVLTTALIFTAVELVKPTAIKIIKLPEAHWGPTWIKGWISTPNKEEFSFSFGKEQKWDPSWGELVDFNLIAKRKMELARRLKMDTKVAAAYPWLLEPGDYLYPGGVYRQGIAVGCSGIVGHADEGLAALVADTIIMLAQLKTGQLIAADRMRIE
ncbi:MAG: hypothetical protein AB1721_00940 [Patescibacteria group bacterium]